MTVPETFGVAGYTTKGRLAQTQVIFHHPDGLSTLMFESITTNGVQGVIVDWAGDGVVVMPVERLQAIAELLAPEGYLSRVRAASAGEAGTATDSEAGVAEGEHATAESRDAQ